MLHVFNVNFGRTMTFDVNLAMERVAELKNAIANEYSLHQDKQVMLISGGQALSDDERVCSYAAGTETNPVYLFDKACIEKETLPSCAEYQQDKGFNESIASALSLHPSYKTVEVRTKLAIRLSEATSRQVACMKSLVHDEHLMYQGWQAAVANLQDTVVEFKERVEAMCSQCEKLFHQGNKNGFVMKGLEEILQLLEKIPVFPSLLRKRGSFTQMNSVDKPLQFSLLRWIETQCKNISIQSLFNECKRKEPYLNQEKYCGLLEECRKVELQTGNGRMREISGINERLAALDHLIITAEQQVKEQIGIAQGFIRNRETVSELQNHRASIDALNTLCESHVTQLRLMQEYEASAREALKKCTDAKNELAANLHTRLRWLYFMQRSVLNADVKLSMFTQQLCHLQHQISFLDQVKLCPSLYLVSVAEVVRRKQFATQYINWTNGALSESQVERDREIVKRKTFHSNLSGHFIQRLFHGLSDKPPSLARKPLRSFDTKLPNITHENLSKLLQLLPMYKDTIEEQDLFSTKDTSRNSIASEGSITEHGNMNSLNTKASVSITPKTRGKTQEGTGSFALVNAHGHIGQSQPGGFVVTSVEGLTQETLEKGFPSYHDIHATESPPHRSHSSPVIKDNDATPLPSLSPGSRSDSVFAPIGDIISPDSPPDSDFYSIMPGNFSFPPKTDANRENSSRKASIASSNQSFVEMSSRYELSEKMPSESFRASKIQSHLLVGSPDSNSSTSYQKVDGVLSSDEEMFHSFTSDHSKDLKSMRKKLHQLQEEYDNLAEESKREKEDLNATVRKMQQKMREMEDNQQTVEADFERRWEETKSELDDVIKQLECERIERKKAWTEGANLEKNLKEARDTCRNYQQKLENLELELQTKTHEFQNLESTFQKFKVECSEKICEEEVKYSDKLSEVRLQHEQEVQTLKETLSRLEKDVTLAQTELTTSEDRIQELETELSQREQVQQETDIQTLELESQIKSLQQDSILSQDSLSKCKEEYENLEKKNLEMKAAHTRAEEQVASLKCILADFETKLNDDRSKDGKLKNLRVQVQQIELEKFEISTALKTSEELADSLNRKMSEMQKEIQSVRSLAMKDAQDHLEEFEKLKMAHTEQLEMSTTKQEEDIKELTQQHETTLKMLQQEHAKTLEDKLKNFESEMTSIKSIHRNELDEVETDRLEAVASAQQTIEDLRSKLRDAHRTIDTEQKESQVLKEGLEKEREEWNLKLECLLREADEAKGERSSMEDELVRCRETIANLQEKKQLNLAQSTLLGSSMMSSTDEEMESKRSKLDSGISEEMVASLVSKEIVHKPQDIMAMSMEDHEKAIGVLRKNFEEDKKALQSYFKKREEEAARRRQMVFNSAIQRVTSSKDLEIERLKGLVMSQSQATPAVTQSMMTPSSQPMVSPETQVHPSPPLVLSQSAPEKDKVTVSSFHAGDIVLVTYNEKYQHFTLLTTSHTLYFVHGESLEKLGLYAAQEFKRSMIFACLTEKEYCQARKAQNRFHVPINTKFYRVKVVPVTKKE